MQAPPPLPSDANQDPHASDREAVDLIATAHGRIREEVGKVVIGQHDAIDQLLIVLFSGGHALLTGAPGLAKTLLVSTLSDVLDLSFQRIQFTPDLMPADISGTEILEDGEEGRRMVFHPGPIFANMILADEINRTPPKTQAALLEAMQEKQVTTAGKTLPLPAPFFVLATQNPIEMEGTYPLPEAQLDRFMFNILIDYLSESDEVEVVTQTTGSASEKVNQVLNGEQLLACQEIVRRVPVAEDVVRFAVRLAAASRPGQEGTADFITEYVSWGAGLRAAQNLVLGGKARALLQGRAHVSKEDIIALADPVLRHRVLANYKAEAQGIDSSQLIEKLLKHIE